ncbi:MAG: hypothetical protein RSC40_09320, partial [Clostridia bacterium]
TLLHLLTLVVGAAVGAWVALVHGCMALHVWGFRFTLLHLLTLVVGAARGLGLLWCMVAWPCMCGAFALRFCIIDMYLPIML